MPSQLTPGIDVTETAALVLRVWRHEGELRCRLISSVETSTPERAAAQGIDAICDAVRQWLVRLS